MPKVNAKRILRIMRFERLTLERNTARRPGRTHDGAVWRYARISGGVGLWYPQVSILLRMKRSPSNPSRRAMLAMPMT